MKVKIFYTAFSLALLNLGTSSCISSDANKAEVKNVPEPNSSYSETLEKMTRNTTLYDHFETRFSVSITYLSPDFYSKMNDRHQEVFLTQDEALSQNSTKLGFFVTIYTADSERMRLDLPDEWNISLKTKESEEPVRPLIVKKIREKAKFKLFFPSIHNWSKEFLILFDQPPPSLSEKLVDSQVLQLTIAGTQGQARLSWP